MRISLFLSNVLMRRKCENENKMLLFAETMRLELLVIFKDQKLNEREKQLCLYLKNVDYR